MIYLNPILSILFISVRRESPSRVNGPTSLKAIAAGWRQYCAQLDKFNGANLDSPLPPSFLPLSSRVARGGSGGDNVVAVVDNF